MDSFRVSTDTYMLRRGIGVHITQIRSVDLDDWKDEWVKAILKVMLQVTFISFYWVLFLVLCGYGCGCGYRCGCGCG